MNKWIAVAGSTALMTWSFGANAWLPDAAPNLLPTPLVRQAIEQDPTVVEARRAQGPPRPRPAPPPGG